MNRIFRVYFDTVVMISIDLGYKKYTFVFNPSKYARVWKSKIPIYHSKVHNQDASCPPLYIEHVTFLNHKFKAV